MTRLLISILFLIAAVSSALAGDDVAITVHYANHQVTIVGPPDDAFCIARREALKLHADKITLPTGTYQAQCPETVQDPQVYWVPSAQKAQLR